MTKVLCRSAPWLENPRGGWLEASEESGTSLEDEASQEEQNPSVGWAQGWLERPSGGGARMLVTATARAMFVDPDRSDIGRAWRRGDVKRTRNGWNLL